MDMGFGGRRTWRGDHLALAAKSCALPPTPALPRCGLRPAGEFRFYPQTLNRLSERPGGNARFFYGDTYPVLYKALGGLRYSALTGKRAAI